MPLNRPLGRREHLMMAATIAMIGVITLVAILSGCSAPAPARPDPYASPIIAEEYARTVLVMSVCADGSVGVGSGVRVAGRGVLTAHHVVACPGMHFIETPDEKDYPARVAVDSASEDVARLEVPEAPVVPPVTVGSISIGARACATFAYPEVGRRCGDAWPSYAERPGDLHLDFVVEHGNSGGPVWNERGELVGITVHARPCRGIDVPQFCTGGATSLADREWLAR